MRFRPLLIGLTAACCSVAVQAGGDQRQRLAAELVVLAGDVRRLIHEPAGPRERAGLERRIAGGLASLPLMLRRAGDAPDAVADLRARLHEGNWPALASQLAELKSRHPFDARPFLPASPATERAKLGETLHRDTCAPCHDNPSAADRMLPAKNLGHQLRSMSQDEFAARLWLGVRGDKTTALRNPFSNEELAALIAWYGQAR